MLWIQLVNIYLYTRTYEASMHSHLYKHISSQTRYTDDKTRSNCISLLAKLISLPDNDLSRYMCLCLQCIILITIYCKIEPLENMNNNNCLLSLCIYIYMGDSIVQYIENLNYDIWQWHWSTTCTVNSHLKVFC